MKWLETTGKTIDEAVELALQKLNVERSQVEIEIIDEGSKGILGMFLQRPAKVKVVVKNDPKEKALHFLTDLLLKMGVEDIKIDFENEEDLLKININGKNAYRIIGKDGEVLDSIQFLTGIILNKEHDTNIKVLLDCQNFRKKKEESLKKLALVLADKVAKTKRSIKLKPMTPYERKIIHTTLQNHRFVTTYSEGEEPFRKVVITLK